MQWNITWFPLNGTGHEHLSLTERDGGIFVSSTVTGAKDGRPFQLQYDIQCNCKWEVQRCTLICFSPDRQEITLQSDTQGHWTNALQQPLPELDCCIDIDISATPFTNTLPIRRLSLRPSQAQDISVVYIAVPEMQIRPFQQRYTCIQRNEESSLYRYESLSSGFTADLRVDTMGLVIDYPGLWKRG